MDWKKIVKEFCGDQFYFKDGDLIPYHNNPKSECWFRLEKRYVSLSETLERLLKSFDENGNFVKRNEAAPLTGLMFQTMIISQEYERGMKAMHRAHPTRPTDLYEVDEVVVDNERYYVIWD